MGKSCANTDSVIDLSHPLTSLKFHQFASGRECYLRYWPHFHKDVGVTSTRISTPNCAKRGVVHNERLGAQYQSHVSKQSVHRSTKCYLAAGLRVKSNNPTQTSTRQPQMWLRTPKKWTKTSLSFVFSRRVRSNDRDVKVVLFLSLSTS